MSFRGLIKKLVFLLECMILRYDFLVVGGFVFVRILVFTEKVVFFGGYIVLYYALYLFLMLFFVWRFCWL